MTNQEYFILMTNLTLVSIALALIVGVTMFPHFIDYIYEPKTIEKEPRIFTGKPIGKGLSLPTDMWEAIDKKIQEQGGELTQRSSYIRDIILKSL